MTKIPLNVFDIKRIASELVGVQPMTGPIGKVFTIRTKTSNGWFKSTQMNVYVIDRADIAEWIKEQSTELWQQTDVGVYKFDEKLEILFLLRWS